jgi:predicted nucleic acid-binding protein
MYLLDTCILLEYLLDQAKADEVEKLLLEASGIPMCITEFSLYSIGINMLRQKLADRFIEFVDDVLVAGQVRLLRLGPPDMAAIAESARRFGFDFESSGDTELVRILDSRGRCRSSWRAEPTGIDSWVSRSVTTAVWRMSTGFARQLPLLRQRQFRLSRQHLPGQLHQVVRYRCPLELDLHSQEAT